MAKVTGGERAQKYIAALAQRLKKGRVLNVGFMEDAKYPDGTSVAEVAAYQNYGAPKANIPPRPFFDNMVRTKSPMWPTQMARIMKETNYDGEKTLNLMGMGIKQQLQQSIRDTNSPPLAESTLAARGVPGMVYRKSNPKTHRAKPLIDTAHMLNSVDYKVSDK